MHCEIVDCYSAYFCCSTTKSARPVYPNLKQTGYVTKNTCVRVFLMKLQALRPATLLKSVSKAGVLLLIYGNFLKNNLFYGTPPMATSGRTQFLQWKHQEVHWTYPVYTFRQKKKIQIKPLRHFCATGLFVYLLKTEKKCSIRKLLLEISQNSQKNICKGVSFSIKLQASSLKL